MGVLDNVLEYKKQKEAREAADLIAIPNAISTFTNARQVANQNALQRLQVEASLAPSGYRIGNEGGRLTIIKDPSLMSDENMLDVQEKRAKIGEMEANSSFIRNYMAKAASGEGGGSGDLEFTGVTGGKPKFDRVTDSDLYKRGLDLSTKFNEDKTVKDYNLVRNQVGQMINAYEKTKTDPKSVSALDDLLISTWKKTLDPTSVIMVQEYATATKNRPLLNRFESAFKKITKGDLLTDVDRQALLQGAMVVANSRGQEFNRTYDRFSKIGQRGKVQNLPDFIGDAHTDYDLSEFNKGSDSVKTPSFSSIEEANSWGKKNNIKPGTKIKVGKQTLVWED